MLSFLTQSGNAPSVGIEEFARSHALTGEELAQVARVDLRQRWSRGDPVTVEWYLHRFPEFRKSAEHTLGLVYVEYLQRERAGSPPPLEELLERFPAFGDQLRMQVQLHQALEQREEVDQATVNRADGTVPVAAPTYGRLDHQQDVPHMRRKPRRQGELSLIGHYSVEREIGRGGMGIVYLAHDRRLNRPVALKVLLTGELASVGEMRRLQSEAEVLARLNHTDIAQIYEVGHDCGRPYLSMEYVNGESLSVFCANRPQLAVWSARLIERLARAVGCAHREGIVHRDLKPANIMLIPKGESAQTNSNELEHEVKIIDFGLAKRMIPEGSMQRTSPPTLTRTGDLIGTPAYMAPEQVLGDAVGPAADIHALGAVLYWLLTGTEPYRGTAPLDIVQRVASQPPVAPSQLVPTVPVELETICLKCLEKSPARRYRSANDLANDLRRFIEHRPILARRATWLEKTRRWAQRNPTVARLLLTIFGLLTVGLTFVTILLWQTKRESARANRNFQYAREAVDTFLSRLATHPDLKIQPLEPLRRDLLITARDFYRALAQDQSNEALLTEDVGQSHQQLGLILKDLGDLDAALQAYQQAWDQFDQLARRLPNEPGYLEKSVYAATQVSFVLEQTGRIDQAHSKLLWAKEFGQQLASAHPEASDYQLLLLSVLLDLTRVEGVLSKISQRDESFAQAQAIYDSILRTADDSGVPLRLASFHNRMGSEFLQRGMFDEAEGSFRAVCTTAQRAVDRSSDEPQSKKLEAMGWSNLAQVLQRSGKMDEARDAMRQASGLIESLAQGHPLVVDYQVGLANCWLNLGSLEFAVGNVSAAESAWTASLEGFHALAAAHPDAVDYRESIVMALSNLGNAAFMAGDYPLAEQRYTTATSEMQELSAALPEHAGLQALLLSVQSNLIAVYRQTGRWEKAVEAGEQLLTVTESFLQQRPEVLDERRRFANMLFNLANACRTAGRLDRGVELALRCVSEAQALVDRYPQQVELQGLLSDALNELGNARFDQRKWPEAESAYRHAREVQAALNGEATGDVPNVHKMGHIQFNLGRIAREQGQAELALEQFQLAISCFEAERQRLIHAHELVPEKIPDAVCESYCEAARVLIQLNRYADALESTTLGLNIKCQTGENSLRAVRARILALLGREQEAWMVAEQITEVEALPTTDLLDLAAAYRLLAKLNHAETTTYSDKAQALTDLAQQRAPL